MGFKTFVAGDVLTAAEVNAYLAKQAVIVCTAATRPTSPVEGMLIYETDTDRTLVYSGAAWVGVVPKGLAASGATLVDLDVTLVSTYQNWGSALVITNPGVPISIIAVLTGYAVNFTTTPLHQVKLRMSLDGGSTWIDGSVCEFVIGQGGSNLNRGSAVASHFRSGTPTGNIHIQAQAASGEVNSNFVSGTITYTMVPT